nr:MAG TPA: hypothetical protein [Caudoviricetes sp.]
MKSFNESYSLGFLVLLLKFHKHSLEQNRCLFPRILHSRRSNSS